MRYPLFAALAALLLAWCQAPAGAAPPGKARDAGYDFVFFGESRPVLVRVRVEIGGRPLQVVWDDFMDQLFKYLDVNGDGVLSKEEAERAPPPQLLLNNGGFYAFPGGPAMMAGPANMDADHDGKVTRQELADYYRKSGAAPFQFQAGGADVAGPAKFRLMGMAQTGTLSADALNERLFELLDTNKDGKLSGEELKAGAAILAKRDADDDETVSVAELMPTRAVGGGNGFVVVDTGNFVPPGNQPGVVMMLQPGRSRAELARQLLRRYAGKGGKPAGKKLTRADLGLDRATFARLDADEDGALDAEELARFDRRPADLELLVRLDTSRSAPRASVEVVNKEGAGPLAANVRRLADGGTVLELGNTRLDLEAGRANGARISYSVTPKLQYQMQFKAADRDGNGYLDEKEARASGFFRGIFKAMDRDGDGKLFEKEMLAYLERIEQLQSAAQVSFASLSVSDQGKGLFDLLDTNHDGRLSVRELRQMPRLVAQLDRDGDGQVSRAEIPRSYRATFRRGAVAAGGPYGARVVFVNQVGGGGPALPALTRGPLWFRKMDRNRDGDVSRREFLGTDEEFRRIDTDGDGLISAEEAEKADAHFRKGRQPRR